MPSFSEVVGVIVIFIVLSAASGHGDWVWKGITEIRRVALSNAHQDWGCPSVWNKGVCSSYEPARYR